VYAIGYVYTVDGEGRPEFASAPSYIGKAPNFMESLRDATEYAVTDIDDKYLETPAN